MPIGAPGKEQFRDAIVEMRNRHIAAGLAPLFLMRAEVLGNDELENRMGMDTVTQRHFIQLLVNCDRMRRRVTHNPNKSPLGDQIEKAIDPNATIEQGPTPFATDDVQHGSSGLMELPWALDGSDPDIPLRSQFKIKSQNALLLMGAIDEAIVAWTRLQSNGRSRFITVMDSMRIYGRYQEILGYLLAFGGDENIVDVAQVLPSEEPRGPENSPNRVSETPNGTAATGS